MPRKGQSLHGERLGQGFYVAPRVEQWTNLDPSYRPLVLRTDRSFRVVGEEWVRRTGRIPTARIARRYGFDGFEGQTEMLVFNMEHIRVLDEVEAIPHLRAGFRKVRPTWNLGSAILESARAILSPDEMADFVPRTMVRNVLAHKRSIAELGKNPARRALVVMTRLGLNPHNPSSVEPLIDALRTSIDDPGIPEDERALRERVLSEVLPLRPTGRTFEERMGPYSAARPLVVRAVRRILREADPPGNVPQP